MVDELHECGEEILLYLVLDQGSVDILHKRRLFLFGPNAKGLLNASALALDSRAYWSFVGILQLWSLVWIGVLGLGHM